MLFGNGYEAALLESKSGWTRRRGAREGRHPGHHHGVDGVVVERAGEPGCRWASSRRPRSSTRPASATRFRAGFLAGRSGASRSSGRLRSARCSRRCAWRPSDRRSTRSSRRGATRLAAAYGEATAAEICAHSDADPRWSRPRTPGERATRSGHAAPRAADAGRCVRVSPCRRHDLSLRIRGLAASGPGSPGWRSSCPRRCCHRVHRRGREVGARRLAGAGHRCRASTSSTCGKARCSPR